MACLIMVVSLSLAHVDQTFALCKLYATVQQTSFIKKIGFNEECTDF